MRAMFSDIKQQWDYLTGDGNVFAVSVKQSYVLKVPLDLPPMNLSIPIGGSLNVDSIFVMRAESGIIVEGWATGAVTGG